MSRASRLLLAASLAATTLALPAVADARAVMASFEARLVVLATCQVQVAHGTRVDVDCASPVTPYLVDSETTAPLSSAVARADGRRVTVYF